jgi:PilZ domain-containing protein
MGVFGVRGSNTLSSLQIRIPHHGGRAVTDWLGRRKHARYPIVVPILYALDGSDAVMESAGWTRDLGEGGACLELPERLEVSALIRALLRTDQGSIEIHGQVIWAEGPLQTGGILHGVSFSRMVSAQHQAVQGLLLRRRMVWRAVVRIPVQLHVIYQLKGQPRSLHQGQTENVSRRGLLLGLPLVYSPGTALVVTLHTPHGHLTAEGTIVRVEPLDAQTPGKPIRHGFHFTDISHATQTTLARVLAEAQ